ncbi:hypothetical protein M1349_02940 [Patescibacteria group bacterium]|nr:hypothetical protein [Patescibacteria group bacterium]
MIKGMESKEVILLISVDSHKLAKFYSEKVGLTLTYKGIVQGNKNLYLFEMGEGSALYIVDVTEKLRDDIGHNIVNLEVDRIEHEVDKFDDLGIKKVQNLYKIDGFGQVATFEDIEGNYVQLIQHENQLSGKKGQAYSSM